MLASTAARTFKPKLHAWKKAPPVRTRITSVVALPAFRRFVSTRKMANLIPEVHPFYEKDTSTIQYVVVCPQTKKAAIIDSVLDYKIEGSSTSTKTADEIVAFVKDRKYEVDWILESHAHADHISAAPYLKQQLNPNAKIGIGEQIKAVQSTFKGIYNLKDFHAGTLFCFSSLITVRWIPL